MRVFSAPLPRAGPGANLVALLAGRVPVICTSAWPNKQLPPPPPDPEAEPTEADAEPPPAPVPPAPLVQALEALPGYADAAPPADGEAGEPAPDTSVVVLLPAFDAGCHHGQFGELLAVRRETLPAAAF